MIHALYANRDTTLYEVSSSMNTGIDQLLELSHITERNTTGGYDKYNSRIIVRFNTDDIANYVSSGKIDLNSASFYLDLKTVEAREIPTSYTIMAYPLSGSWSNGTGRCSNKPYTTDGASWTYRTSQAVGTQWQIPVIVASYTWDEMFQSWVDSDFYFGSGVPSLFVTSSYVTNEGGGNWYFGANYEASQSFEWESSDIYMDVTNVARHWFTSSQYIANDGFLLKFNDEGEKTNDNYGRIQFYSTDTNTIYVPRLLVYWDDFVFSTGSLSPANAENIHIHPKLKRMYKQTEKAKIRLHVREKFPQKQWVTTSPYMLNYYLPTSSYYEVRDNRTNEVVIPFDDMATKISCDANGNFFNVWMDSFQPERFYKLVFKVVTDGGDSEQYFDNNYVFKVTR